MKVFPGLFSYCWCEKLMCCCRSAGSVGVPSLGGQAVQSILVYPGDMAAAGQAIMLHCSALHRVAQLVSSTTTTTRDERDETDQHTGTTFYFYFIF